MKISLKDRLNKKASKFEVPKEKANYSPKNSVPF